ncbi:MAG: phosphoenolpyruvate--protein phosphotransferase [Elusimicrobiota bacterium]|jgi:phosphotransferase system enzyme I (PtsI)|nr:phosphoenolpyruvate--protein phosphotransferase [Elusimicrobiota bacterium]
MNKTKTEEKKEIRLNGAAVSAGIAIGKVFLADTYQHCPPYREIPKELRQKEMDRFKTAVKQTKTDFKATYTKIYERLGKNYAKIADAHILILEDPALQKKTQDLIKNGSNAEYAVYKTMEEFIVSLDSLQDEYFRDRRFDLQDVCKKLIDNLSGQNKSKLSSLGSDSIIAAHNLTPADTVAMREQFIKGFATDIGGKTSHTAIVARGFGIPAVVGLKNLSAIVKNGDAIIIDGNRGIAIVNPLKETVAFYEKEFEIWNDEYKGLEKLKDLPSETKDGVKIAVLANIDSPEEAENTAKQGIKGIGLYRTEFLYFNRSDMPSEEEHFENYKKAAESVSPFETIIRTLDLGGDKLFQMGLLNTDEENNPFMGLRAIRLCLKFPKMFKEQIRGILRASAFGKIKIMYPMISGIEELKAANNLLEEAKESLRKANEKFDENIEVGAMIEVPSAAVITDLLAKELDFVSIGTNDLIQYTLAVDRVNEDVAYLYDPIHPSIIRLLKQIIDGAVNAGIKSAMCGEMAGDPFYTPLLLGLGLKEFSVSPIQSAKIKKVIRAVKISDMQGLADEILKCGDRNITEELLNNIKKTINV